VDSDSLNLVAFIFLFIGGPILWSIYRGAYIVVYFGADIFIDGLKDLCEKHNFSPLIVGLISLGVDPEESGASIFASIERLPHVAIGNVVGNTIIALAITFGLPALFFSLDLTPTMIYPINLTILVVIILMFARISIKNRMSRGTGIIFLLILAGFVFINSIFGILMS
jgi:Ca2+/Na+ antiporter